MKAAQFSQQAAGQKTGAAGQKTGQDGGRHSSASLTSSSRSSAALLSSDASACPVVLFGAGGRMALLLQERLQQAGYPVRPLERENGRPISRDAIRNALRGAAALILCVPVEAMPEVLELAVPELAGNGGQQPLIDIASIKVLPMRLMEAAYSGPVIGTHPLFGPVPSAVSVKKSPEQPAEFKVAVTPGANCPDLPVSWLCELLSRLGFAPFVTTAQEHDKAAASIQGLNFVTSVAYFAMLADHPEILPFLTPSFQRRLEASRKSLTEDGRIFCAMFNDNPASNATVDDFRAQLAKSAQDIGAALQKARWWLE